MPRAKKRGLSGMEAFSKAGGLRARGGREVRLPDDPWQEKEAGGANWKLQNSSVERSPGGTVSAIRRITRKWRNG